MENKHFDRTALRFRPISQRTDETGFRPVSDLTPGAIPSEDLEVISLTADNILAAREKGASRILTFGTDLIRNGLSPVISEFIARGWITHLATTGTSVVDDWEFATRGAAAENGAYGMKDGSFGMWEETSRDLNLAVLTGAWRGLGLGESICAVMLEGKVRIPSQDELEKDLRNTDNPGQCSAAAALLDAVRRFGLKQGDLHINFPYRENSLMYMAAKAGIPFTVHPMFGLDVPFMHPMCSFAAVGKAAEKDFLYFVSGVKNLEDGVYLSVGSSVASPMIFEKALSMSQNVLIREGRRMTRHKIVVVDLAPSKWDWMHNGEPPETRPEYYLRYCKSFSRAKAETMHYVCLDNRDFFLHLKNQLESK